MVTPSKSWVVISDSQVAANAPVDTILMTGLRDNLIHLEEWMGDGYTAAKDHDHDNVNSKSVTLPANSVDTAELVDGAVTQAKLADYVAGTILAASSNTEETTGSASYVKLKEFRIARNGELRVYFELKSTGPTNVFGRIYVNGSPVGIERSNSTSWTPYSEDLAGLVIGDLIQLYLKDPATVTAHCRNFRLQNDFDLEIAVLS